MGHRRSLCLHLLIESLIAIQQKYVKLKMSVGENNNTIC